MGKSKKKENIRNKEDIIMFKIFKAFRVLAEVSMWAEQAMKDGKITPMESAKLIETVADILDINLNIEGR